MVDPYQLLFSFVEECPLSISNTCVNKHFAPVQTVRSLHNKQVLCMVQNADDLKEAFLLKHSFIFMSACHVVCGHAIFLISAAMQLNEQHWQMSSACYLVSTQPFGMTVLALIMNSA